MLMKQKLVVISGAGVSAESGLKTFRDHDGLWEGHDVEEVATYEAWKKNPALVLDFYNQRRAAALNAKPNAAHYGLAYLEQFYEVTIITQNVDDLHERAGSSSVVHLHGSLFEKRSEQNEHIIKPIFEDMKVGALASDGALYRPNIVWFGEAVPLISLAQSYVETAEIVVVVGTSLLVYPAAGLLAHVSADASLFVLDKKIPKHAHLHTAQCFEMPASKGIEQLLDQLVVAKGFIQ